MSKYQEKSFHKNKKKKCKKILFLESICQTQCSIEDKSLLSEPNFFNR